MNGVAPASPPSASIANAGAQAPTTFARPSVLVMFYACLAMDNGIDVDQGVIVRADGNRVTLPYDVAEISEFGKTARKAREDLNNDVKAGKTFTQLTSPSSTNCANCPCMPVCDVFWMNADSSWQTDCGANFEGIIEEADETNSQLYGEVVTLKMTKCSGTVDATTVSMSNIPRDWLTDFPSAIPLGQKIRIIKARLEQDDEHAELKFDKASTTCWLID